MMWIFMRLTSEVHFYADDGRTSLVDAPALVLAAWMLLAFA
jgi:hypothetical protein